MSRGPANDPARGTRPGRRGADEEELRMLFARLPDGAARDELVLRFRPLARSLANRFAGRGESLEDLVQVATIGLVKAVDRFAPERDVRFTTYATATIVGEIKRHFRDRGWALRVPRQLKESGLEVSRAAADLHQRLGRSPTVAELSEHCRLSGEEVLEALEAMQAYSTTSLDAPGRGDQTAIVEQLGDDDHAIDLLEGWTTVAPLIRELPDRERYILYARFFREMTQTQIAADLGISQMHVSRLLAQTLRKLREAAAAGPPSE